MSKFQLPCSCGAIIPVSVAQAGASVPCPQCGSLVEVPGTRALRALQPFVDQTVTDSKAGASAFSKASPALRTLAATFLIAGLGLFVLGGMILWDRSFANIEYGISEEEVIFKPTMEETLEAPPAVIWDKWKLMIDDGFPKAKPLPYFQMQRALEAWKPWMIGYFVVGSILIALFLLLCLLMAKGSRISPKSAQ